MSTLGIKAQIQGVLHRTTKVLSIEKVCTIKTFTEIKRCKLEKALVQQLQGLSQIFGQVHTQTSLHTFTPRA